MEVAKMRKEDCECSIENAGYYQKDLELERGRAFEDAGVDVIDCLIFPEDSLKDKNICYRMVYWKD